MKSNSIQSLKSWKFNSKKQSWIPDNIDFSSDITVTELTLVTYNVWFADYQFKPRCKFWLDILSDCNADAIALQEITPKSLEFILQSQWVRKQYYISDITGKTVTPYGVVLLSKIPLQKLLLYNLPSNMNRQFMVADLRVNGETLKLGTVHLESQKRSASIRAQQIDLVFPMMENAEHSILMGDFNLCSSWSENDRLDNSYQDLWAVLRNDEPGYTEDTDINLMRLEQKGKEKQVRFDRILLRSASGWQPKSIEKIGTEPLFPERPNVFPSDHFGLVGKLRWQKTADLNLPLEKL